MLGLKSCLMFGLLQSLILKMQCEIMNLLALRDRQRYRLSHENSQQRAARLAGLWDRQRTRLANETTDQRVKRLEALRLINNINQMFFFKKFGTFKRVNNFAAQGLENFTEKFLISHKKYPVSRFIFAKVLSASQTQSHLSVSGVGFCVRSHLCEQLF